jgi:hypothetical protein
MVKKFLLATVAAFALATGAAHADDLVKVDTAENWSIAYNKDRKTCNAYADYSDGSSLSFGHREDYGIWRLAVLPTWSNWFAEGETIDVNITFSNGKSYGTHARIESVAERPNKKIVFQMTEDMLYNFENSSTMKIAAWVGNIEGREYSTTFSLKGTRLAAEKVSTCQGTALARHRAPGQAETRQYTFKGQKVVINDAGNELVSMSNLAPDETTCYPHEKSGKVVHVDYTRDGLVPVSATIEEGDGRRWIVKLPDTRGMGPMATRSWIVGGLQRYFKEGNLVDMTVKLCGASGRFIVLDAISRPTSFALSH